MATPWIALKPDFEKTAERFEAWWVGELIDRPPVTVQTPAVRSIDLPDKQHASLRERWMDVEYQVELGLAQMRARDWRGDSIPAWAPNVGPELTSTVWGCELEFGEHTSWSKPIIESVEQWQRVADAQPNFEGEYWQTIEQMTRLAIERFAGEALVGIADLHGNYDILAGLREPADLCLDLMDDPQLVFRAVMSATRSLTEGFERLSTMLAESGTGSTTWAPFYHAGRAYVPSSDFWCMLSDTQARELVLPAIEVEMKPLARSIFHLDGPQALRHLDLLLEMEDLDAVQWVFGAGAGPACNWIEVYRRCLAAGKSIQVMAESPEDAIACLEALGPRGVWLAPVPCESNAQALDLIKEVERLTAAAG